MTERERERYLGGKSERERERKRARDIGGKECEREIWDQRRTMLSCRWQAQEKYERELMLHAKAVDSFTTAKQEVN